MLPCPYCSNVIHAGALSRAELVTPSWLFAKMTTAKQGRDHFSWAGCKHSGPIGPVVPIDTRGETEAKWDVEARRLFELRTVSWTPDARETFGRMLGFNTSIANPT